MWKIMKEGEEDIMYALDCSRKKKNMGFCRLFFFHFPLSRARSFCDVALKKL